TQLSYHSSLALLDLSIHCIPPSKEEKGSKSITSRFVCSRKKKLVAWLS
uniref:Uncharacterized protein n=1 Tax=Aegilops tauschii subsp. strangulata TaxID=200361 RepID=A0A453QYD2_AEGTS